MKLKHFDHFHIAGFTFYEGVLAFDQLKVGTELKLVAEPKNRYDENAVAIYIKKHKLGFVPRSHNLSLAVLLNAGYDIFETRVQQIKADAHPEDQLHTVVFVKAPDGLIAPKS